MAKQTPLQRTNNRKQNTTVAREDACCPKERVASSRKRVEKGVTNGRKWDERKESTSCDVSVYLVWADVDAIYQVLKQAGEIRGNSTNSPPTPPTADHPPAPSSARASSHPCSSSTSGKTQAPAPLSTLKQRSRPLFLFRKKRAPIFLSPPPPPSLFSFRFLDSASEWSALQECILPWQGKLLTNGSNRRSCNKSWVSESWIYERALSYVWNLRETWSQFTGTEFHQQNDKTNVSSNCHLIIEKRDGVSRDSLSLSVYTEDF